MAVDRSIIIGPHVSISQMEITWNLLKRHDGTMWRSVFNYVKPEALKFYPNHGWCSASNSNANVSPEDFIKMVSGGLMKIDLVLTEKVIVDNWGCGCSMLHGHVNGCRHYKRTPYDDLWCL